MDGGEYEDKKLNDRPYLVRVVWSSGVWMCSSCDWCRFELGVLFVTGTGNGNKWTVCFVFFSSYCQVSDLYYSGFCLNWNEFSNRISACAVNQIGHQVNTSRYKNTGKPKSEQTKLQNHNNNADTHLFRIQTHSSKWMNKKTKR